MKKFLALMLAALMVLSMFAGCNNSTTNNSDPTGTGSTETTGTVVDTKATYTYNYALSTFPTNWNYCTYQTATDAEILDYIVDGFYSFDYNEDMTGYKMVDAMAVGDPKDVTADYVGQYGIEEGDTAQAYVITIRDDLYWNNGDHITTYDFVESAKRLLDPTAQNYRADSMYSGSCSIYGAESYLKQGLTVKEENAISNAYAISDLVLGDDGVYYTPDGGGVYIAVSNSKGLTEWLSGRTLEFYVNYAMLEDGTNGWFDITYWEDLLALVDDEGFVTLTSETLPYLETLISGNPAWGETAEDAMWYLYCDATYPEYSWDNVGWVALSDYELLFVMTKPLSGFYLKYNLFAPLVHLETYDACAKIEEGVYTNTYGTSAETTMSYGPYVLTAFQKDKQYTLEKNEYYYGLTEDTYQTTTIVVDCVAEASTKLELFLQGKLDSYGLTKEDMETYQLSDYTYWSTGASTYAITFNPNYDALVSQQALAGENINKTILTVKEFRMAMSFALDRNAFCLATSPTNGPAFGLYSTLNVSDPEAGVTYRSTDPAKNVLAEFWGVKESIGTLYEDIDEAIDSITGYNLTKGQQLFNEAYDIAISSGLMDADDIIEIKIGIPNPSSTFYSGGYEYLVNCYTEAVKGTKLEGKLTFSKDDTVGNDFADALINNQIDMLFGVGWSGSALDPYGLMEAYVSSDYQYDASTDYTAITCDITINGTVYTASVWDWYCIMNGETCTIKAADGSTMEYSCGTMDNDPDTRLEILAALEGTVLMNYCFIPIMDASSASLRGMQINYKTEEYVFGMGFGGIKYYTYNYSDAEWEEFVASNNGSLDYT